MARGRPADGDTARLVNGEESSTALEIEAPTPSHGKKGWLQMPMRNCCLVLVLVVVLALLGLIRTTSNQIGLLADVRWQPNKYVRICEVRLCDPDGVSADDADSVQACADSIAQRAEDERRLSIVISAYFYNPTRLALSLTTLEFSLIAGLAEVAAHHPASTIADLPYLGIAPENLPLDSWADSEWHEVVACRKSEGDLIVAAETTTLITLACNVASDDLAATLTSLLASTTQTPLLLHDAIAGSALGGLLPVETGIHTPLYAGYTLPSLPELTASAGRRLSEWMPHELTNGTGEAAPPEAAPSAEAAAEPVDVPHPSSPKPADKPENWEAASDATELLSSEVGCVGYDEVTALIPPTQAAISFCGADASALQQTLTQAATECVVSLANDAVENLAEHAHDRASQMAEHASEIALSGNPRDALANLAGQGVGGGIGGRLQGGEATGPGLAPSLASEVACGRTLGSCLALAFRLVKGGTRAGEMRGLSWKGRWEWVPPEDALSRLCLFCLYCWLRATAVLHR